jgi:hypothetical protein
MPSVCAISETVKYSITIILTWVLKTVNPFYTPLSITRESFTPYGRSLTGETFTPLASSGTLTLAKKES